MALPKDPSKWAKPPKNPTKTARYRGRMITGFIMESDIYKGLGNAIIVDGVVRSPIKTLMDETDYGQLPDLDKLKKEVKSHINGWHKEVKKAKAKKAEKEAMRKAKLEAKMKIIAQKRKEKERKKLEAKLKKESDAKRKKDFEDAKARLRKIIKEEKKEHEAKKARERLRKKIAESKKEKNKSYEQMTREERRAALKANDDEAWKALEKELKGESDPQTPPAIENSAIPIIKVSASGSFDEDYSFGEFNNIVTTTITLSFYNVGTQVNGYGGVTFKTNSVASLNGSSSQSRCGGTFSGGPNGRIKLSGECAGMVLQLRSGSNISFDKISLSVSSPAAFSHWTK
ncbi:MAG: hypothetical protein GY764_12660 [Halieaceae bacterium]|nr:hypothetical protein [Halieaceae bacterium]